MSKATETGSGRQRKSTGFFPRTSLTGLTSINDGPPNNAVLKKKARPSSSFFMPSAIFTGEGRSPKDADEGCESPKTRPRTLIKNGMPSSLFSSVRPLRPTEEEEQLTSPTPRESSIEEEQGFEDVPHGGVVLHHGETQATGGLFRKRKEYLVLTDSHLLRFKSYSRAVDMFPS